MLNNLIKTGSTLLSNYEVLKLDGDIERVEDCLQGQVTSDINDLANENAQTSCLLDHKGFIQADFIIYRSKDVIYIIIESTLAEHLIDELDQVIKFYQVKITKTDEKVKGIVIKDGVDVEGSIYFKNNEFSLSIKLCPPNESIKDSISFMEWKVFNKMLLNYVFVHTDINKYRPNELNYDKSRVSFTKGCYKGQEIIARVNYLGVNRREFVSGIISKDLEIDSRLKIHGEILEFSNKKIFSTHLKRDESETIVFESIDFIKYSNPS